MRVTVVRLWKDGIQVPKWQLAQLPVFSGELQLVESRDEHLNRHMRSAHLIDLDGPENQRRGELLPPLVDAAVLWIKEKRMTISGFERGEMVATYAQTWLVEIVESQSIQKVIDK